MAAGVLIAGAVFAAAAGFGLCSENVEALPSPRRDLCNAGHDGGLLAVLLGPPLLVVVGLAFWRRRSVTALRWCFGAAAVIDAGAILAVVLTAG